MTSRDDALDEVLDSIEEFLEGRSDVRDGDDGRPRPNDAMSLLTELQQARLRPTTPTTAAREALIAKIEQLQDDGSEGVPWTQDEMELILAALRDSLPQESVQNDTQRVQSSDARVTAALHACEGLDTSDLAGNEKGWLSEVVHSAAHVENRLNYALRACCAGNTDDDEPVRCQSYEASEQAEPCPRGCCVMAEESDMRAVLDAVQSERGKPSDYPAQHANADGWTDWISPTEIDMYGLQCCGCGLKHEMQFNVLRNKAYTDGVHWYADAVPAEEGYHVAFRMRRDTPSPSGDEESK